MTSRTLSVRLLDRFRLLDGRAALPVPPGTERVLALLAVRGGILGRSRAAGILWPEVTEQAGPGLPALGADPPTPAARPAVRVTPAELSLADGVSIDLRTGQALARRLLDRPPGSPGPTWAGRRPC